MFKPYTPRYVQWNIPGFIVPNQKEESITGIQFYFSHYQGLQ